MKNVDVAFRYIRAISLLTAGGCIVICSLIIYKSYELAGKTQDRIYVLAGGKVLEAFASERKDNIGVEGRDHVKMFHFYFFTLSPDEKAIQQNINKALYLADRSAKSQYDDLKERNYYSNLISGNVNQTIQVDSVMLDTQQYPYYFRCFASQELTRPTSIVQRRLVTEGFLRNVSRSENNAHGFLVERWNVIENTDVNIKSR
ncbi:conjugative transposon protein TraK [Chitinophaga niabensis]|nr:conjugative transposon protein TraK [Chitinophaga niabensis]